MTAEEHEMLQELQQFLQLRSIPETARYLIRSAWVVLRVFRATRRYERKRGNDGASAPVVAQQQ